ncbi:uncharacterized protein LOC126847396 isoform X2 [Adelges cooleyi]|uniref:uncharacterized protein LOC126847396 isoform X2 n=1 Tax=Adelges cooleyi TaxID=133065 RepID=UPI00217F59A7|nr:uncharacterized protein LOC126847396 isoform X2 [Adelges cooleyi]
MKSTVELIANMEQIVKIFVRQSYFVEEDLVVDYNFEQEAQVSISPKDWIALIPKGWSGVDEQVAFKNVNISCDEMNHPIKSIVMEKSCFQNVVECEKQYQLMYIGQYLEILGRSEYFTFYHQTDVCNCVTLSGEPLNKDKPRRISSVLVRRPPRRQSPTPREFYKNRSQSQMNVAMKNEGPKPRNCPQNLCSKCMAPNNYSALESSYLTKIQNLTTEKEVMEQRLLRVEKDLVQTLDVLNKQFMLNKAFYQQKENIQRFIDELVEGLLNDGRITFWASDQEFTVVREFEDKERCCGAMAESGDVSSMASPRSPQTTSREAYLKAIIGQQEQTIQHLVAKIKESFDLFLKVNPPAASASEQHHDLALLLDAAENNKLMCSIGYMDSSGTTYFTPPPFFPEPPLYELGAHDHFVETGCKPEKMVFTNSHITDPKLSSPAVTINRKQQDVQDEKKPWNAIPLEQPNKSKLDGDLQNNSLESDDKEEVVINKCKNIDYDTGDENENTI